MEINYEFKKDNAEVKFKNGELNIFINMLPQYVILDLTKKETEELYLEMRKYFD